MCDSLLQHNQNSKQLSGKTWSAQTFRAQTQSSPGQRLWTLAGLHTSKKVKEQVFYWVTMPTCQVKVSQLLLWRLPITLCLWLIEAPDSVRINVVIGDGVVLWADKKAFLQVSSGLYHKHRLYTAGKSQFFVSNNQMRHGIIEAQFLTDRKRKSISSLCP